MYERKIPLDYNCGVSVAMEVIGSKWKFCLIVEINAGTRRPKDLHEAIPGISKRVLHQQLKEMELHGIICKKIYPEVPARVEYFLTEEGRIVLPLIENINQWGKSYAQKLKNAEIISCLSEND